MMKPHPPRGRSHNATDGLLIEIDGDRATVDAQFMVFTILGDAKPASGWPAGAGGAMGRITPIESGYHTQKLVRALLPVGIPKTRRSNYKKRTSAELQS